MCKNFYREYPSPQFVFYCGGNNCFFSPLSPCDLSRGETFLPRPIPLRAERFFDRPLSFPLHARPPVREDAAQSSFSALPPSRGAKSPREGGAVFPRASNRDAFPAHAPQTERGAASLFPPRRASARFFRTRAAKQRAGTPRYAAASPLFAFSFFSSAEPRPLRQTSTAPLAPTPHRALRGVTTFRREKRDQEAVPSSSCFCVLLSRRFAPSFSRAEQWQAHEQPSQPQQPLPCRLLQML